MIYCRLQYMQVCRGGLVTTLLSPFVPSCFLQSPTGFNKQQFGVLKTYFFVHGRGGMMLEVEECTIHVQ